MKKIIITSPEPVSGEVYTICRLLSEGVYTVHLRRPGYGVDEYRRLLEAIPSRFHGRLVLHDYFELAGEYAVRGIHLNSRCTEVPCGYTGGVSCSCHSLREVARRKPQMDYVFLSPVFDSISKLDYHSAFSVGQLRQAAHAGIIDDKVFALGGVTIKSIPLLQMLSFGGAVFMGEIWKR